MSELIRPIEFYGAGQCSNCLTPLNIYETETIVLELNNNGIPIRSNVEYYNMFGLCPRCGERFNMEKQGIHYRVYFGKLIKQNRIDYLNNEEEINPFRRKE